jgi:hypothetical protein
MIAETFEHQTSQQRSNSIYADRKRLRDRFPQSPPTSD